MLRRALISVYDKTDLVGFAGGLTELGVELVASGGTARALRDAGLDVTEVSALTGFPEVLGGRVKTLHPAVHAGILSRRTAADDRELGGLGVGPIDLVVVNLYPFEATVARGAPHEDIIENIDIGGPSMVRSAAKNHARVTVVVEPGDYPRVLEAMGAGGPDAKLRADLARKAFAHTAAYDGAIASYLSSRNDDGTTSAFPGVLSLQLDRAYQCRYGENPHQRGAFYVERNAPAGSLSKATSLDAGGKELSYNNLVDLDAALDCVREFEGPAAVVVKHTNPCGVALGEDLESAFRVAREADSVSAFGGIVALNRPVDAATATAMAESFLECVIAPGFDDAALEVLRKKKNLRILATGAWLSAARADRTYRRVDGGLLAMDRDATGPGEVRGGKVATKRAPTDAEMRALEFSWAVSKHVKSNAIVLGHEGRTVGVGAGQMSRVISVEIALQKAGDAARGSVLASDAFFPFPDGVLTAAKGGVTAVAQPGGSMRDEEVIAAANEHNIAMVFTGVRHFRH
ncbi:MAG: bifunctional phosphoribosylaminoimidazolecarboxamide formyltransferase/IMP cyclohydrolase [Myxococcales bacterium]|nr:bifunctional phosphoribosylaminoimidazolecarboxamide formyltransferase/IMP cyclohydrolase [Myxococcales bacterium]